MKKLDIIDVVKDLIDSTKILLKKDFKNTCSHDEVYRGGAIWTICSQCGKKWADDEGGMSEYQDPEEWDDAQKAIDNGEELLKRLEEFVKARYGISYRAITKNDGKDCLND
ncbi:MAG: hypothetical protein PHT94_00965 [Candidatus Nanoarchaeia archaeon]|nr:hypothetical protein [Candidatus Nanoarchaeia archaeon]